MKLSKKDKVIFIVGSVLFIVAIPGLLYLFVDQIDLIHSNIYADTWLNFWAAYFGGICTLLAVVVTVFCSMKLQRESLEMQAKELREDRRLQYSPLLKLKFCEKCDTKCEQIYRYAFSPNENISNITADKIETGECWLEISNVGFGPATNIFVVYDGKYVINGSNQLKTEDFIVQESFNLSKDSAVCCDFRIYAMRNLLEANPRLFDGILVDFIYQDICNNCIRKKVCISMNSKLILFESNPEYLRIEQLKEEYPHICNIDAMLTQKM